MKIEVVGSAEDVAGFALAGLPGRVAETGKDVEAALRAAVAGDGEPAGFLLVSAGAARLAPDLFDALEERDAAPVVLSLPEEMSP